MANSPTPGGLTSPTIAVWNNANTLITATGPNLTVPLASGPTALEKLAQASETRLLVGTSTGLSMYAGAETLTASAVPVTIPAASFSGGGAVTWLSITTGSVHPNLWALSSGRVARFADASTLNAASIPTATFVHTFDQIYGAAYLQSADRLFAAQVSGGGLLAYNAASTASTASVASNFVLLATPLQDHLVTYEPIGTSGGARLFSASYLDGDLRVWADVGSVTASTAPSFSLAAITTSSGTPEVRQLKLVGTTLIASGGTISTGVIALYTHANLLTSTSTPTVTLTHATLKRVEASYLGADDTLYALDDDGVSIFSNASTAPVFKVELKTGITSPTALIVVE